MSRRCVLGPASLPAKLRSCCAVRESGAGGRKHVLGRGDSGAGGAQTGRGRGAGGGWCWERWKCWAEVLRCGDMALARPRPCNGPPSQQCTDWMRRLCLRTAMDARRSARNPSTMLKSVCSQTVVRCLVVAPTDLGPWTLDAAADAPTGCSNASPVSWLAQQSTANTFYVHQACTSEFSRALHWLSSLMVIFNIYHASFCPPLLPPPCRTSRRSKVAGHVWLGF